MPRHRRALVSACSLLLFGALGIGISRFHTYQNRPRAIFGYFSSTSSQLLNTGTHFHKNGMLSVVFKLRDPLGGNEHMTYSLSEQGMARPLLTAQSLGTAMYRQRGSWDGAQFPIDPYRQPMRLEPGKYVVKLYYNGTVVDSGSFYADKSIVV